MSVKEVKLASLGDYSSDAADGLQRRAQDTAVIRKPDYVHVIGRRPVSVVYAAPVSVTCSDPFAST